MRPGRRGRRGHVLPGRVLGFYSRSALARLFPDALIADEQAAAEFGLNAVSDGRHVLLPQSAVGLFEPLRDRGFEPIGMDLSELLKGGGSVKCCTQELRGQELRM